MPPRNEHPPTDVERRTFHELADDVAYLRRGCHLFVAPYHGEFRIGAGAAMVVVDAAGLQARAQQERERRRIKAPQAASHVDGLAVTRIRAASGREATARPSLSVRALPPMPPVPPPTTSPELDRAIDVISRLGEGERGFEAEATPPPLKVIALCPCGRPNTRHGRCWHRRGLKAPPVPTPKAERKAERRGKLNERVAALERQVAELRQVLEVGR